MIEITTVETRSIPTVIPHRYLPNTITIPPELLEQSRKWEKEFASVGKAEKFAVVWRLTLKFTPYLFNIIAGFIMGNTQKIIAAVVGLVVALAAYFGFDISAELTGILTTVLAFIVGLFMKQPKDKNAAETK